MVAAQADGARYRLHEAPEEAEQALKVIADTAERLLTESLTNALKYGELTEPVEVTETWGNGYRLTVTNTVRAQDEPTHQGHGLDGMAERVRLLGGTFRAGRDRHQWQVEITLPTAQGDPG